MALRYTARFYTIPTLGNHVYDIEIDDANFVGEVKQLELGSGGVVLDYEGDEQDTFPTIIPSFLTINLIADESFQLNHIYTDNERSLRVTLKQDGQVLGNYFVIPDGTRESFTSIPYDVSIRCIDGLGLLRNYEYTTTEGKDNIFNIIRKCLNNLGLSLNINTFCRISYQGSGGGSLDDQYRFVYVHQERFEGMRCDEVLEQLLKEWVSGLVQMNGEWYLFRWPDVVRTEGAIPFNKYDSAGNLLGISGILIDHLLGTDGEVNLDLMHSNYDQVRSVNMAYKSVRIRYEYGFIENLLNKDASLLRGGLTQFDEWTKQNGIDATPRRLDGYAKINGKNITTVDNQNITLTNWRPVVGNSRITVEIQYNVGNANSLPFTIAYRENLSTPILFLGPGNVWTSVPGFRFFDNYDEQDGDTWGRGETVLGKHDFVTPSAGGIVSILIAKAYYYSNNSHAVEAGEAKIYYVGLIPAPSDQSIISETHEVVNNGDYTSRPDPIEVSTGESLYPAYIGTIFQSDQETPTDKFKSVWDTVYYPFLTLAAKDILFQHGRPMTRYEGSILGYFPILSRLTINDLPGVYMPVKLSYDFKNNIVNSSLNEVNADPVPHTVLDIVYEKEAPKNG